VTRPWQTLDAADSLEGRLELRRRGEDEFVLTVGGRVLMSSLAHSTELAAAEVACRRVAGRPRPRVLIGGLGMGFTLRAALDALPRHARVTVAEIDPTLVRWCRGPLAPLTAGAVDDPRVRVEVADVARVIAGTPTSDGEPWDAIVLDLYEGPRAATQGADDPFYGRRALTATRAALAPNGLFAVWSEDADAAFEKRLAAAGFRVDRLRPGMGGPRHVVYLAEAAARAGRLPEGQLGRTKRRVTGSK
jgi:spermidine synthase